jgi:hypothetical protein
MAIDAGTQLELDVARLYESEVQDRATGVGIRFVTLPVESLADPDLLDNPAEAMEVLGLKAISDPVRASHIPYAVASILLRDNATAAAEHLELVLEHERAFANDHADVLAFAEYVTYANVVPVERSPLSGDSLGNLLASGSGASAGLGLGIMVAGGPTPLLFVTVPVGIILVMSAKGIGGGLAEGLSYRIRKLLDVPAA